jgi:predicted nucleic acid-binding protein
VIVVDTSTLISFLRGLATSSARHLRRLEQEGTPFAIPGLCCQELLQGARDEREWRLLLGHLETQELLFPLDPLAAHVEAARIFFECRRRGVTIRSSTDCLIACLALERDAVLLHEDEDFERIKVVRPLRTMT